MVLATTPPPEKSLPSFSERDILDALIAGILAGKIQQDSWAHQATVYLRRHGFAVNSAADVRSYWRILEEDERTLLSLEVAKEDDTPTLADAQKVVRFTVTQDILDAYVALGVEWRVEGAGEEVQP